MPSPGTTISVTSERAIVSSAAGVETIVLSLNVDSKIAQTGLIIPTPSAATVSPGDPKLFDELDSVTTPTKRYVDDWWGTGPAATDDSSPVVVSRVAVGGLEATTLSASNSSALGAWLAANGFAIPVETSSLLTQYVAKGWYFTAIKLAATKPLVGPLDPIQISFPASQLIYPLGMSRAATTGQSLRLYVLADTRTDLVQEGTAASPLNAAQRTVWAGAVSGGSLATLGKYLTVTDLRFDQPATQIGGDIGVAAAPNNDSVDPTVVVARPIELLGIPLGTLLAVWGGLGLLALLGAIVARSRLR